MKNDASEEKGEMARLVREFLEIICFKKNKRLIGEEMEKQGN